jgi:hypothetical protein
MKKIILVTLIGFVSAGCNLLPAKSVQQPSPDASTQLPASSESGSGIVVDTSPKKCTTKISGSDLTVYFADGKELSDTVNATYKINTHTLLANGKRYYWGDGDPYGVKMELGANGVKKQVDAGMYIVATNEKIGTYHCDPWTPDASKFLPPAGLPFRDVPPSS